MEKTDWKERLRRSLVPTVNLFANLGIPPTAVTLLGLLLSLAGAWAVASGHLFRGGLILLIGGLCDAMDGLLARTTNKVTRFGAFLDSTTDRISEAAVYLAIILYFLLDPYDTNRTIVFLTVAAFSGAFLTSYTRARAEGLGLECTVGLLERTERVVLLTGALILAFIGDFILVAVMFVLAVLTWITVFQRIHHVRKELDVGDGGQPADQKIVRVEDLQRNEGKE